MTKNGTRLRKDGNTIARHWQNMHLRPRGCRDERELRFGRASANSSTKKRGHTQYEFDPLLSVLPNPRPTLPFQRRQHPRQLFLTTYLLPLSIVAPEMGPLFSGFQCARRLCWGGLLGKQTGRLHSKPGHNQQSKASVQK